MSARTHVLTSALFLSNSWVDHVQNWHTYSYAGHTAHETQIKLRAHSFIVEYCALLVVHFLREEKNGKKW